MCYKLVDMKLIINEVNYITLQLLLIKIAITYQFCEKLIQEMYPKTGSNMVSSFRLIFSNTYLFEQEN